jgi:hypothetical protein
MPFKTTRGEDSDVAGDMNDTEQPSNRLPLFNTIIASYRFVGEHLLSFVLVATLAASVHFIFLKLAPSTGSPALFTLREFLHSAAVLAGMVFASAVFATFGTGWYRRQLMGQRRRLRFGPQEARFTVVIALFYLVLLAPTEVSRLDSGRSVMNIVDRLEQLTGYPAWLVWPTITFFWRVLATAVMFFAFPAIALDVRRPLAHAMTAARRAAPSLALFYLVGLVPWFALDMVGVRVLIDEVDPERLLFARLILSSWMMACTFALAGAAYKELAERRTAHRLSAAFD